jgi:DNA polymerase-3 subunit chi
LICISDANVTCEEVSLAKRVCIVFQGDSSTDVEHARNQWKALADEGVAAKYWDQSSGNWELKAETPAK